MLGAMGKRDTELETDAELWARVARGAKPLEKGMSVTPGVEAQRAGPRARQGAIAPDSQDCPKSGA